MSFKTCSRFKENKLKLETLKLNFLYLRVREEFYYAELKFKLLQPNIEIV